MAELLAQLISRLIRNSDPNNQKEAEAMLLAYSEKESQNFCLQLLQIGSVHEDDKIRMFAISHLRKRISLYSEKSFNLLWPRLDVESQTTIKQSLFSILASEPEESVRNLICDCIGELGGSLIEDNKWPELIPQIWNLFMQSESHQIQSGFKILSSLLAFAAEQFQPHKQELAQLFLNGVKNQNSKVQVTCIKSIGTYILAVPTKEAKEFQPLVQLMLQSLLAHVQTSEDYAHTILEVFSEIIESEPGFFKENFELLFSAIWEINMVSASVDVNLKHKGTEVIISFIQRIPETVRNHEVYITRIIEMIFKHMIEIESVISEQWATPPEGYVEEDGEDEDSTATRFGMNAIDRIIQQVGSESVLPILSSTVEKLLQHSDWRYNFSAIMALSQVGEYIEEVATVSPIIDTVLSFLKNENPKLRYAVFHAIGQISDDMKPKFQAVYKDLLMPILLQYLDDPVQRVVSHTAAAITNFVEGLAEPEIKPYLQQLLQKLFAQLFKACSFVKENCITAVASIAEASKHSFHEFFNECMPMLFKFLETHSQKQYQQLRGQTVECITLIAHSVDKSLFLPYLQQIINVIVEMQSNSLASDSTDPQKKYVLTGWQRLSFNYHEELKSYLSQILPGLFQMISHIEKTSNKTHEENSEIEVAVEMLKVLIDQFSASFAPYIEPITRLIIPLLNIGYLESIRKSAISCFPSLVKSSVGNPETQRSLAQFFLSFLVPSTQQISDSAVLTSQVYAARNIISIVGSFMKNEDINELQRKILKLLMESNARIDKCGIERINEYDEYQREIIREDLGFEEDLQIAFAELSGALFATHKMQTVGLAEVLYQQVLPKVLSPSVSYRRHVFGLVLINNMMDHMGFEVMESKWSEFATALTMFANDSFWQVRQSALFGIGIFATRTPVDKFSGYTEELMKSLVNATKIPQKSERPQDVGIARDKAVGSIGKLMKYQGVLNQEIFQFWLQNLPLKFDSRESNQTTQFLSFLVVNRSDLIISPEIAVKILLVLIQVIDARYTQKETAHSIRFALKKFITENPIVLSNRDQILAVLPPAFSKRINQEISIQQQLELSQNNNQNEEKEEEEDNDEDEDDYEGEEQDFSEDQAQLPHQ